MVAYLNKLTAYYLFYNLVLLVFDFTNQFLDFSYLREKNIIKIRLGQFSNNGKFVGAFNNLIQIASNLA